MNSLGLIQLVSLIQRCYLSWNGGMLIFINQIINFYYLLNVCSASETAIGTGRTDKAIISRGPWPHRVDEPGSLALFCGICLVRATEFCWFPQRPVQIEAVNSANSKASAIKSIPSPSFILCVTHYTCLVKFYLNSSILLIFQ